ATLGVQVLIERAVVDAVDEVVAPGSRTGQVLELAVGRLQGVARVIRFEDLEFSVGNAIPGDHAGGAGFGGGGCALAIFKGELDAWRDRARAEERAESRIRVGAGGAGALGERDLVLDLLAG